MGVQQYKSTRMGWTAPPAAPRCPCCKSSVFPAEAFMAVDRTPFHKKCVKCTSCSKALTSATLNEHKTQLYCKGCYDGLFQLQSPGGAEYGGIVTAEDLRRMEEEEKMRIEKAKRAKQERRCPSCDRKPDEETPMMLGPREQEDVFEEEVLDPYCKFCFAKHYKLSALNIAESVTIL